MIIHFIRLLQLICFVLATTSAVFAATPHVTPLVIKATAFADKDIESRDFPGASMALSSALSASQNNVDKLRLEAHLATTNRLWSCFLILNGKYREALQRAQTASVYASEAGNENETENSTATIAYVESIMGNRTAALDCYERALKIATETGDRLSQVQLLVSSSELLLKLGQTGGSLAFADRASRLASAVNDLPGLASSQMIEGQNYRQTGKYAEAISAFRKSLPIASKLREISTESVDNGGIGGILTDSRMYSEALPFDTLASTQAARANDLAAEEVDLAYEGDADQGICHFASAVVCFQMSFLLAEKLEDIDLEAEDLTCLAGLYSLLSQFNQALLADQKCLALDQRLGNGHNLEMDFNNVSSDFSHLKQYGEAAAYAERALSVSTKTGDIDRESADFSSLATISRDLGESDKASAYDAQAAALIRKNPPTK